MPHLFESNPELLLLFLVVVAIAWKWLVRLLVLLSTVVAVLMLVGFAAYAALANFIGG